MSDGSIVRADRFLSRRRGLVGWALFAVTLCALVATLDDPGITWDEPAYYGSAQLQVRWVKTLLSEGPAVALDRDVVYQMWDWDHYHNPHPPLYKEGMALTWWATSGLLGPLAAFRLFPAILFAGLVLLLFRWGCSAWGGVGGLGAALSTALMPRLFGHAHLGATETPLVAFWVAATAAGWWAIERRRWTGWVVAGVAWGFAAGTKFTGLAALTPLAAWGAWRDWRFTVKGIHLAGGVALVVFTATNPMMWVDPGSFLETWVWESTHRGHYAAFTTFYLDRLWAFGQVPWHHAFVLTAATVPLGILALAGFGSVDGIRRRDPLAWLAVISVVFVWGLMLLPTAPHHDGVRQFVTLFPFLGLLGGYGLHAASNRLPRGGWVWVAALVFLPAAFHLVRVHPYHLAYYGEVVGGVQGARERGFETTYWMDAISQEVLDWMNENLPEESTLFVVGTTRPLEMAQGLDRLRSDIRLRDRLPADYMVVPMRQSILRPELEDVLEEVRPIHEVRLQGVRMLAIYEIEG